MKILIVSTSDMAGGAARAGYRLHKSLISQNIDSKMLVQSKSSDEYLILTETSKLKKILYKFRPLLDSIPIRFYKSRTKTLFSSSWLPFSNIVNKINELQPDIVHLHWICAGMIRIEDLEKIHAPIVWSLHDMWAFTGGCHYDEECGLYKQSCGNCKVLNSYHDNDLSRYLFKKKLKVYSNIKNMTVVGSSQWISQCARESTLFEKKEIVTLPNCLDTKLFKDINQEIARDLFNIPKDKKVILFGAVNSLGDPRKGSKELLEAIDLVNIDDTIFVIAGSSKPMKELSLKYPVYFIPPLYDEVSLALLYNVADVMVVPSLQENLANSIIESLSCSVPVVAFDIGGNSDMIKHKINGYLAKAFNTKEMANGIEYVLKNQHYDQLSRNARETAISSYDSNVVAKKYIDLYKRILGKL